MEQQQQRQIYKFVVFGTAETVIGFTNKLNFRRPKFLSKIRNSQDRTSSGAECICITMNSRKMLLFTFLQEIQEANSMLIAANT